MIYLRDEGPPSSTRDTSSTLTPFPGPHAAQRLVPPTIGARGLCLLRERSPRGLSLWTPRSRAEEGGHRSHAATPPGSSLP